MLFLVDFYLHRADCDIFGCVFVSDMDDTLKVDQICGNKESIKHPFSDNMSFEMLI